MMVLFFSITIGIVLLTVGHTLHHNGLTVTGVIFLLFSILAIAPDGGEDEKNNRYYEGYE
jgi:hypothetical protein